MPDRRTFLRSLSSLPLVGGLLSPGRAASDAIGRGMAVRQLREGEPSIEPLPGGGDVLGFGVWMMQPGDEKIVARRIREILRGAAENGASSG
jgi:hypothetical protein